MPSSVQLALVWNGQYLVFSLDGERLFYPFRAAVGWWGQVGWNSTKISVKVKVYHAQFKSIIRGVNRFLSPELWYLHQIKSGVLFLFVVPPLPFYHYYHYYNCYY